MLSSEKFVAYTRRYMPILIGIALSIRLLLALFTTGNFDTDSFVVVADIMQRGGNVYAETARYNYSPIWFNLIGIFSNAGLLFIPFVTRVFMSLVDLVNIAIAYRLAGRSAALALAFSPILILMSGWVGQFEALAILPILLALRTKNLRWIFILGTIAILIKHNTVFIVWGLFIHHVGVRRSILWVMASSAFFLLSFAPYLQEGIDGIIKNVFLYSAVPGRGITFFVSKATIFPVFIVSMIAIPILSRSLSLLTALTLIICVQLFLLPGMGSQYFVVPVMFLILDKKYKIAFILSVCAAFYGLSYDFWFGAWALCGVIACQIIMQEFFAPKAITPAPSS